MSSILESLPRIVPPPVVAENSLRRQLAKDINGPLFVADLLLLRGIQDKDAARAFFLPEPAPGAEHPFLNLDRAVGLLVAARERGERVAVHGDYDVDGVTGTAVLYLGLKGLGFDAIWILPNRFEGGYGMSRPSLDKVKAQGAQWVISVDTGMSAVEEVEYARGLGLKVIVTDHHQAPPVLPDAEVILNPNQPGCPYTNKGLSGCGVAYRLLEALTAALKGPDPTPYLDLVAMGSLADSVPVTGENRALLRAGLRRMASSTNQGLRTLLKRTGVDSAALTSSEILFKVTPMLNAMGRMGSPEISLRLFLSENETQAHEYVDKMEVQNAKRRKLDQAMTLEAIERVEKEPGLSEAGALVLASRDWHEGVIGIVAARLVDRFRRPSFVLAIDAEGFAKGSGRTIKGFHLTQALSSCAELFEKFGGHEFACGFTIREENIPAFREAMVARAQIAFADGPQVPEITPTVTLNLEELDADGLLWLRRFEPFGPSNVAPLFYAENVELSGEPRKVGDKHLKFAVRSGDQVFEAIAFNLGHLAEWLEDKTHLSRLAFYPEWNSFRGSKRIQLRVTALE